MPRAPAASPAPLYRLFPRRRLLSSSRARLLIRDRSHPPRGCDFPWWGRRHASGRQVSPANDRDVGRAYPSPPSGPAGMGIPALQPDAPPRLGAHIRHAGVTSLGGAGVSPANDRQHVHGRDSSASGGRPRHHDPTATERWPIPTLRSHTTALRSMLLHRQYVPLSAKRLWSRMNRGRPGIYALWPRIPQRSFSVSHRASRIAAARRPENHAHEARSGRVSAATLIAETL